MLLRIRRRLNGFLENSDLICAAVVGVFLAKTSLNVLKGEAKGSWGYGEFWINYSGGYIRRGLSGEILIFLREIGLTNSYLLVVGVLTIVVWLNFILLSLYLRLVISSVYIRVFLQLNATLFLFLIHNPNAYIRKDHFIVLGLLLHALISFKVQTFVFSPVIYIRFVRILILSLILFGQFHEIQALFIPVHLYLYLRTTQEVREKKELSKLPTIGMLAVMITTLITSGIFHGTRFQVDRIIDSIPKVERVELGAIEALGWTSGQAIDLSFRMFRSEGTLLCFGLILIIGPILITYLTGSLDRGQKFISKIAVMSPLVLLFFLGWDWGRWLVLISFSLLVLTERGHVKFDNQRPQNIMTKTVTILLIAILSLPWGTPECCNRAPEEAIFPLMNFLHENGIHLRNFLPRLFVG
jgi:hypothetical protein